MLQTERPRSMSERMVLLQLIASLTLCDHMGDVSNDIEEALRQIGVDLSWDTLDDLRQALHTRGITTLYGTSLSDE